MKLLLPFIFCSSLTTNAFEIVAPEASKEAWSHQAALERAKGFKKDVKTLLDTRIIGGGDAPSGRYPYFTYIELSTNLGETFFCSGTLIWEDAVLTAAHCVVDLLSTPERVITGVGAYVGAENLSDLTEAEFREAELAVINPSYNSITFENDIAVFKLKVPVLNVSPVQLNFDTASPADGIGVDVFGFGATSTDPNDPLPDILQTVSLFTVPFADCNDANSFDGDVFEASMICAGVPAGGKVSSVYEQREPSCTIE